MSKYGNWVSDSRDRYYQDEEVDGQLTPDMASVHDPDSEDKPDSHDG
jgi:hypothetical protein